MRTLKSKQPYRKTFVEIDNQKNHNIHLYIYIYICIYIFPDLSYPMRQQMRRRSRLLIQFSCSSDNSENGKSFPLFLASPPRCVGAVNIGKTLSLIGWIG